MVLLKWEHLPTSVMPGVCYSYVLAIRIYLHQAQLVSIRMTYGGRILGSAHLTGLCCPTEPSMEGTNGLARAGNVQRFIVTLRVETEQLVC